MVNYFGCSVRLSYVAIGRRCRCCRAVIKRFNDKNVESHTADELECLSLQERNRKISYETFSSWAKSIFDILQNAKSVVNKLFMFWSRTEAIYCELYLDILRFLGPEHARMIRIVVKNRKIESIFMFATNRTNLQFVCCLRVRVVWVPLE